MWCAVASNISITTSTTRSRVSPSALSIHVIRSSSAAAPILRSSRALEYLKREWSAQPLQLRQPRLTHVDATAAGSGRAGACCAAAQAIAAEGHNRRAGLEGLLLPACLVVDSSDEKSAVLRG